MQREETCVQRDKKHDKLQSFKNDFDVFSVDS